MNAIKEKRAQSDTKKSCLARCLNDDGEEQGSKPSLINVDGYSIEETANWARAANIGAVLVLTICAFLYGYFA